VPNTIHKKYKIRHQPQLWKLLSQNAEMCRFIYKLPSYTGGTAILQGSLHSAWEWRQWQWSVHAVHWWWGYWTFTYTAEC